MLYFAYIRKELLVVLNSSGLYGLKDVQPANYAPRNHEGRTSHAGKTLRIQDHVLNLKLMMLGRLRPCTDQ
jgi:hypothetical protein